MNIIHFADYHLGVDTYGPMDPETRLNGRVLDFLDTLDSLIDYAYDFNADLVLFAGDAFHRNNPSPTLLREFGKRMVRLSKKCPVVLLVGNHDMASADRATSIDVFDTLEVDNVIVGRDYEIIDIDDLQIATFPWPSKYKILADAKTMDVKQAISDRIRLLTDMVDVNRPAMFLGHFSVSNAVYGSERDMTIGDQAEVQAADLVGPWSYVALGHIHYHQNLAEQFDNMYPVIYPGSLDRVDFGEEKYKKGFIWLELKETMDVVWDFVEVDARPFVTVSIDAKQKQHPTAYAIAKIEKKDLRDAVVRVQIEIEDSKARRLNMQSLNEVLDKSGMYFLKQLVIKKVRDDFQTRDVAAQMVYQSDIGKLKSCLTSFGIKQPELGELMKLGKEIIQEVDNETRSE